MPVWVPPASSKTITFPLNEQSNTFQTDFYEPEMTNEKVSLADINQFIAEINTEYMLYKFRVRNEKLKSDCFGVFMAAIFFLDIYIFFSPLRNDFPFTNGETIILTWSLYFLVCILWDYKPKLDFISQMKDQCQDIVDKQNQMLRSKGLKWHIPDQFPTCIELTEDMEKKNNHFEIPYGVPETTDTEVIFPLRCYKSHPQLPKIWRFSHDFFEPEMADGKISCKEVHDFLCEINTLLRRLPPFSLQVSWVLFLSLSLELFGLLYIYNHFANLLTTFQMIIIAVLSGIVFQDLSERARQRQNQKTQIRFKSASQKIVNKYNETLKNQGLRWHLPDQFSLWIELCKMDQNYNKNFLSTSLLDDKKNS